MVTHTSPHGQEPSKDNDGDTFVIVGVVVGSIVIIVLVTLLYCCCKARMYVYIMIDRMIAFQLC